MSETSTTSPEPTVFVVDDDEAVRDSLELLFSSVGLAAESFSTATAFLDSYRGRPGCLVLDLRMPGMSGLDLQERLAEDGIELPIVFITGHGDVPLAVRAMRAGAVDFLQKPFSDQDLLDRVHEALERDAGRRRERRGRRRLEEHIERLTPREREVLDHLVRGHANKVIASRLGLSRRTVEIHRANLMRKMEVDSLAELVRQVVSGSSAGGERRVDETTPR